MAKLYLKCIKTLRISKFKDNRLEYLWTYKPPEATLDYLIT